MSKTFKALAAVSVLALVAACGQRDANVEEFVVVDPAPAVTVEPVFDGKYN